MVGFAGIFVLNVAGILGAAIAGKPEKRSKWQFRIGSIISSLGQSYVYMAYVAFVAVYTHNSESEGFLKVILWIIAFLSCIPPLWRQQGKAKAELNESQIPYANPQVEGLILTSLICTVGFFILLIFPSLIETIWGWLPIHWNFDK